MEGGGVSNLILYLETVYDVDFIKFVIRNSKSHLHCTGCNLNRNYKS